MNVSYFILFILFSIFTLFVLQGDMYTINGVNDKKNVLRTVTHSKSMPFILTIITLFALLCATRSMDSYDVQPYVNYLHIINSISLTEIDGRYGLGFETLTKILVLVIHDNYVLYFGIVAAINCVIVWRALKKIENVGVYGFILYLGFLGFYYNFIVIRQAFAISFVLLAYSSLMKLEKKWIIFLLIAILFHESAVLALVIIFWGKYFRLSKYMLYILLGISLLFYLTKITDKFINPILGMIYGLLPVKQFYKYILYFDNVQYKHDISLLYLLYFVISFIIIYVLNKWEDNISKTIYLLETCNVIGLFLLGFFSSLPAISRAADYLSTCTYVFLIPIILKYLEKRGQIFVIIMLFLMIIFLYSRIILGVTNLFI